MLYLANDRHGDRLTRLYGGHRDFYDGQWTLIGHNYKNWVFILTPTFQKKKVIWLTESPLKMMKIFFYLILKYISSFILSIFVLPVTFLYLQVWQIQSFIHLFTFWSYFLAILLVKMHDNLNETILKFFFCSHFTL